MELKPVALLTFLLKNRSNIAGPGDLTTRFDCLSVQPDVIAAANATLQIFNSLIVFLHAAEPSRCLCFLLCVSLIGSSVCYRYLNEAVGPAALRVPCHLRATEVGQSGLSR